MSIQLLLISVILLLNLISGLLFQVSNEVVCFTELSIVAISGLVFWTSLFRPLQKMTAVFLCFRRSPGGRLVLFGGAGIAVSILNLLFCQLMVYGIMWYVFHCISPSFNLLTASVFGALPLRHLSPDQ